MSVGRNRRIITPVQTILSTADLARNLKKPSRGPKSDADQRATVPVVD
jgi:hypothetical protein